MNQDGTRDLAWWRIPAWASPIPRIILTGLVTGLVFGLAGLWLGLEVGLGVVLVLVLVGGLAGGLMFGRSRSSPQRVVQLQWRQLLSPSSLMTGLLAGLVFGLAITYVFTLWVGPGSGLGSGLGGGLVVGLGFAIVSGLQSGPSQPGPGDASPLLPRASWRRDQAFARMLGLVIAIVFGFGLWVVFGIAVAPLFGLVIGPAAGLAFGLMLGLTYPETWTASLAFAQLANRWHTPPRLLRFLEDARDRDVLRTVGPVYQFRHARLQDRLASQASTAARPGPQAAQARLPAQDKADLESPGIA